mgnify:FL=1
MKFKVIHEDYWPVPETIQDDLTIDQARELLRAVQSDNPENDYFICESKDAEYKPIKGNWCHPNKNTN